ncbi:MAG: nitroreductase family protein [Roseburia sp.]|nr:nitroreductase family protein [Anaeroplasma bactoclasticum]MCM1196612.1 nitroreductase family protein [Roseburia sp.]MCM1557241.1 nitroreductase family protein [Anaeroplasma bactoclasticum]
MNAIFNRRSVRDYDLSKKIEYKTLLELCKAAEAAPTARNQRSREYIIIEDEMVIEELSKVSKGSMILSKCNTVIAVIGRNKEEISTPHMQDQDLACAVENLLIEATSLGLGSCYIGIHPLEDRVIACDKILGVTGGDHTFALVALGYPKDTEAFYDKNKFSDDLVHHNRY